MEAVFWFGTFFRSFEFVSDFGFRASNLFLFIYFRNFSGGMKPWRKVFSETVRGSRNCNR